jgi:hypothetical protein
VLDSSANDMMQGSGGVYAGLAGHGLFISQIRRKETHNFMTVPYPTYTTRRIEPTRTERSH